MKKILNKITILFLAFLFIFSLFISQNKINAKTSDLDRINSYIITVDPNFDDGSLNIQIDISWKVLDSTSEGPLTWVKIGVPNYHVENIKALTDNIKKIKYMSDDGSFIRVDFKNKYYANEVVNFSFSFNQSYMYFLNYGTEELVAYDYSPGYFNEIYVDKCILKWNKENVKTIFDSALNYKIIDGYYVYESPLSHSETIRIHLDYDRSVFKEIDPNKTFTNDYEKYPWLMPLIVISIIIGVIILVSVVSRITRDPYKADRGFYGPYNNYFWFYRPYYRRYRGTGGVSKSGKPINPPTSVGSGRGFHGGSGCACACACACAGGGRAGCSMKDFYHTNIRTKDLKESNNNL
jgi:hypothetical protein